MTGTAVASTAPFQAGAPGIGDPYFPLEGNGGYDVGHYTLDLGYQPAGNHIDGVATIEATATENLSSFNLDLVGLTVHDVTVDGRWATWSRTGGELTVTPAKGLRSGRSFTVVVRYDGVPVPLQSSLGLSGVFATDDGMVIAGEPDGAATWFPVNDHPLDKASYTFRVTVPEGLQVVANGRLHRTRTSHGQTTFVWQEQDPMNSYLATATVGKFVITDYRKNGIHFYDAIDPTLLGPVATPVTGTHHMSSGAAADGSYKRLMHTFAVPARRRVARLQGHARHRDRLGLHVRRGPRRRLRRLDDAARPERPHELRRRQLLPARRLDRAAPVPRPLPDPQCRRLLLAQGHDGHVERRDRHERLQGRGLEGRPHGLCRQDGRALDLLRQRRRRTGPRHLHRRHRLLDRRRHDLVRARRGHARRLDGAGRAGRQPRQRRDFTVGTVADEPDNFGVVAQRSFAREPEILKFLASTFGPYPFRDAGGIVDHLPDVGFALENQTRPIYAQEFFYDQVGGDSVVVHELTHQWYGDSVSVHYWADIWLNEGFATYAEWLWSEHEGLGTAQEIFDGNYANIPADDPFWTLVIGDPGPEQLFDAPVYTRGAMALHELRLTVGDPAFFRILQKWAAIKRGGNGSIAEFITARRAHLGPGSRHALHDLALHAGQARRARCGAAREPGRERAGAAVARRRARARAGAAPLAHASAEQPLGRERSVPAALGDAVGHGLARAQALGHADRAVTGREHESGRARVGPDQRQAVGRVGTLAGARLGHREAGERRHQRDRAPGDLVARLRRLVGVRGRAVQARADEHAAGGVLLQHARDVGRGLARRRRPARASGRLAQRAPTPPRSRAAAGTAPGA